MVLFLLGNGSFIVTVVYSDFNGINGSFNGFVMVLTGIIMGLITVGNDEIYPLVKQQFAN